MNINKVVDHIANIAAWLFVTSFIIAFIASCIDNAKHGIGTSNDLTILPDTANHVICYTMGGGSVGLSCVHVDHPIVYQIENNAKLR